MEEENIRELRSSRSRSNTPLIRPSRENDRESMQGSEQGTGKRIVSTTITRTRGRPKGSGRQKSNLTTVTETRSEVSVKTQRQVNRQVDDESDSSIERTAEDDFKGIRKSSEHQKIRRRMIVNGAMPRKSESSSTVKGERIEEKLQHKTSDYSSEEGEGIAYRIYKRAGDWWNKFPKTDYTYSPISPHRKEVAPGVIVMPNMSRRSLSDMRRHGMSSSDTNIVRSSTRSSVTTQHKSKSHWNKPPSTSDSLDSKKVLEDWLAVDSDVDEVAEKFSKKTVHTQSSWSITTFIKSFFVAIWTFISSSYTRTVDAAYRLVGYPRDGVIYATPLRGISQVGSEGGVGWLQKIFSWCYKAVCSLMQMDLLLLSSLRSTQVDQEPDLYYEEEEYVETDALSRTSRKQRFLRLFLLLLPLLFLTGWWWYASESNESALRPVLEVTDVVKNTLLGWMLIPVDVYGSLKKSILTSISSPQLPPVIIPHSNNDQQQQKTMDMESLAHYILGSSQFQEELASKVHDETQAAQLDSVHLESIVNQQKQFHQDNAKLLEEHRILLAELTSNLKNLQEKIEHVDGEQKRAEARKKDWEDKWEKEKLLLREETTGRPIVPDSDQVLLRKELRDLQSRFKLLQDQQAQMMRRCCQRGMAPTMVRGDVIEQHVIKILADLLGATGGQYSGNPEDLRVWISNMMVAREDLEARLANLTVTLNQETRDAVLRSKEVIMASVKEQIQNEFAKWHEQQRQREVQASFNTNMGTWTSINKSTTGLSDLQVRAIVDEALAKYDADKTGLVDYALESSGGSILSTRCTETYQAKTATLSLLGIPLWHPSNNPRTVIQPGVHPGECWAFSGSQGFLVIKLSGLVQITGFTVEHIPRALSPYGRIDSAPKDFTVWGLKEVQDSEPVMLGKYTYQQNGTSLQNFSVQRADFEPFELVELRIESNHGNIEYTCLYRFRVHGVLTS